MIIAFLDFSRIVFMISSPYYCELIRNGRKSLPMSREADLKLGPVVALEQQITAKSYFIFLHHAPRGQI